MANPEVSSEVLGDEEEEDEELDRPMSSSINWDALLLKAEGLVDENDAEEEEETLTPLEHCIKTLKSGKQCYRMKAIRDIGDFIETNTEETMQLVLPEMQNLLKEEKTNLDLQCEAAVLFKDIFKNSTLFKKEPTLPLTLLDCIIDNAQRQKDNLSAAAWLETLTEVAHALPLPAIRKSVVPVLIAQSEPSQRVQRRLIATKLLEKLAKILPATDIRRDLERSIQQLSCDENSNVRASMGTRLATVAAAFDTPKDISRLVLPCLLALAEDDDVSVVETALPTLVGILDCVTREARKSAVSAFFRRAVEKSMKKKDDRVILITRYFGEMLHRLFEDLDLLDQTWALNSYVKLVTLFKGENACSRSTATRRACAYNLPCMIQLYPKASSRLTAIMHDFCTDHDDEVRLSIAASFDSLLEMSTDKVGMLAAFIELVRGGSIEVVAKMSRRLSTILPKLYPSVAEAPSTSQVSTKSIDRLLIGCNQLLEGSGAWRAHEALLHSIATLPKLTDNKTLVETFVPLLKKEVLTVRAHPCRIAACRSLLLIMRQLPRKEDRLGIIQFFQDDLAMHSNSYRRIIYLEVVMQVLSIFSRRILHQHFLHTALAMSSDPVSNIRIKLCRMLPLLKGTFVLPGDDELLTNCESTVRNLLEKEKGEHSRALINDAAKGFSRANTGRRHDAEDKSRIIEEDTLWDEEKFEREEKDRIEKEKEKRRVEERERDRECGRLTMSRSMVEQPSGSWRLERRAVAIVRPQPVVHVRSQSPAPCLSPSPSTSSTPERKSRLPLSTSKRSVTPSLPSSPTSSLVNGHGPRSPTSNTASLLLGKDRLRDRAQSETRSTSSLAGRGSSSSSSSSYALSKSASSSHLRRPTFALSKVSSQSNIERRPASMSMRIKNINVL